jgi:hypothetical protein
MHDFTSKSVRSVKAEEAREHDKQQDRLEAETSQAGGSGRQRRGSVAQHDFERQTAARKESLAERIVEYNKVPHAVALRVPSATAARLFRGTLGACECRECIDHRLRTSAGPMCRVGVCEVVGDASPALTRATTCGYKTTLDSLRPGEIAFRSF